jgi:phage gp46-like protein
MLAASTPREADLERNADGSLLEDDGLETVVAISLFTDAKATTADGLEPGDDPRGYWADAYDDEQGLNIGSKLWLLEGATMTEANLREAEAYAKAALEWMIADGAADRIECKATRLSDEAATLDIALYKPGTGSPYQLTWELHFALQ